MARIKHGNTTQLKPFFRYLSEEEFATLPRDMKAIYLRMAVRAASDAEKPASVPLVDDPKPKSR